MGFIKEPKGITFYVENRELTNKEKELLSKFLAEQRMKNRSKLESIKKKTVKKRLIKKRALAGNI